MNNLKNKAENIYLQELKKVESGIDLPGNLSGLGTGITYGGQLAKLAKKLFGSKFKGVFAADEIAPLRSQDGYFIYNLDKKDEPGSHWIGIVKSPQGILVYDSFGRDTKEIIPGVYSLGNRKDISLQDTEDDAEQKEWQDNCGARTIAFLKVYDEHGSAVASLI